MNRLTQEQIDFASERHEIVCSFLKEKRLKEDEFYDVVIFAYLQSVQRYMTDSGLNKYDFKDIAYQKMTAAMVSYLAAKKRSGNIEFVSIETMKNSALLAV